eukprot:TRINITY_DN15795_c0_g1_i2.p1 TRINITY_DN15795_c0_g1~~TRINITY_DN15795_c0_g1_i2.p1  ORF type:complete len:459 (+),score=86.21 TRINITY_DN15795_c0_g1_i2:455-1831(+)
MQRLWIFHDPTPSESAAASICAALSVRPAEPEIVLILPGRGVKLKEGLLRFGASTQDLFSVLGPPTQVSVKDMDKVRIHSGSMPQQARSGPDYFYNYFNLGLDVMFDGSTHLAKKIVLHTNPPSHERFSRYSRCFFELHVTAEALEAAAPGLGQTALTVQRKQAAHLSSVAEDASKLAWPRSDESGLAPREEEAAPEAAAAAAVVESPPLDTRTQGEAACSPEATEEAPCGEDAAEGDETTTGGRRLSKKERKAVRQKRKMDKRGLSVSPQMSVLSTPESSPLLTTLKDEAEKPGSPGTTPLDSHGKDAVEAWDEVLPPAAVDTVEADPEGDGVDVGTGDFTLDGFQVDDGIVGVATAESSALEGVSMQEESATGDVRIDVQWPWARVQQVLGPIAGSSCYKPLHLMENGHSPYRGPHIYALPGLAFEVMQNDYVASVTVCSVAMEKLPPVLRSSPCH